MTREIVALALRMAQPLRSEFGFSLDTERTLKDERYVRAVNAMVDRSHDQCLKRNFAEMAVCLDELWGTECPDRSRGAERPMAKPGDCTQAER
jgi:hypothetical protein